MSEFYVPVDSHRAKLRINSRLLTELVEKLLAGKEELFENPPVFSTGQLLPPANTKLTLKRNYKV